MNLRKKLPSGWSYILSKKELTIINSETDNAITSVILNGTSYSESKIAGQQTNKTVGVIDFRVVENDLCSYLTLYGIRTSNFKSDEELVNAKTKVISDITKTIIEAKNNFTENNSKSASKFIKVATGQTTTK